MKQIMESPQVAKMEREMALTTPDVYFGEQLPSLLRAAHMVTSGRRVQSAVPSPAELAADKQCSVLADIQVPSCRRHN